MERVLIIEDDELVRDLAFQVLHNHGYQVQFAANLAQSYKIMETERFDLFLIDIVLPDGSGVDFVERYQSQYPNAAYILSSGYNEDKPQIKQTLAKGYTFLHKPYTISDLLNTCKEAMASKQP
jgi:DNA-binding NtrC family response regulator